MEEEIKEQSQQQELPAPEIIEVETPRGIRVRLTSYRVDIDHLTIRATELINFIKETNDNDNDNDSGSSYIQ